MNLLIKNKDKRGMSVGDIYPVMLTIALVAILIAVVLIVLTNFSAQSVDSFIVTNESGWVNATQYTLGLAGECGFTNPSIISIVNGTDGIVIANANATLASSGVLNATSAYNWNDTRISYSGEVGEEACEATETIITQISDFVPWIGIILLIVAAAIVIGILIKNLAGGKRV